jgi:hypothetical protein
MIVRFQADADRNFLIVRTLLRGEPDIDLQSATQAGLAGLSDPEVLALATTKPRCPATLPSSSVRSTALAC